MDLAIAARLKTGHATHGHRTRYKVALEVQIVSVQPILQVLCTSRYSDMVIETDEARAPARHPLKTATKPARGVS